MSESLRLFNKMLDISLIGFYFFVLGTFFALIINKYAPDRDNYEKKPTYLILLHLFIQTSLIMIGAFLARFIVKKIPYPLDGVWEYNHSRTSELNGAPLLGFVMITLQYKFADELKYLIYNRLKVDENKRKNNENTCNLLKETLE